MWDGFHIGAMSVDSLKTQIGNVVTWAPVFVLIGIPLAIIIASYVLERVYGLGAEVGQAGAKKFAVAMWPGGTRAGKYGALAEGLEAGGWKRVGDSTTTEYWARENDEGIPDIVKVATYGDNLRTAKQVSSGGARKKSSGGSGKGKKK